MIERVFEDRFVAFIDILGFARLVARAEQDEPLAVRLVTILKGIEISSQKEVVAGLPGNMTSFSDSVVVTSEDSRVVFGAAVGLQRTLLQVGALSRGGVTRGLVHHERAVVVGPAMVRAYRIESEEASMPRMVIDAPVVARLNAAARGKHFEQDVDGRWFLAPFYDWALMREREKVQHLGSHLVQGLTDAESEGSGAVAKWSWMIKRFNAALAEEHPDMDPIEVNP